MDVQVDEMAVNDGNRKIKILHQNVQCLSNKVDIIESTTHELDVDLLCVTEHWMKEDELVNVAIPGYTLKASYCRNSAIHGGVAIFSRCDDNYTVKVMKDITTFSVDLVIEVACVELVELRVVLVCMYRSPSGKMDSFFENFQKILSRINCHKKHLIICGDFNINFLSKDKNALSFINICKMYGLERTIFQPTRGKNCLDNIFTTIHSSSSSGFTSSTVNCHISDHCGQILTLNNVVLSKVDNRPSNNNLLSKPSTSPKTVMSEDNIRVFKYHLKRETWNQHYNSNSNVNTNFDLFLSSLKYFYSLSFIVNVRPSKRTLGYNKVPWYNKELKMCKDRLMLLFNLSNTIGGGYKQLYNTEKTNYRQKLKETKKNYNVEFINNSTNKTKALWTIINRNRPDSIKPSNNKDCVFTPDQFNSYFVSVVNLTQPQQHVNNGVNNNFIEYLSKKIVSNNISEFSFSLITEKHLLDAVKSLSPKKSFDYLGISNVLLKEIITSIVTPLTVLFNDCIVNGVFPTALKKTKVIPIFKKGARDHLSNYRPIAIVPILSKVLEIIMSNQLLNHFQSHGILCKEQFGFRRGLSTTHALLELTQHILNCFEGKDFAAVTFCDLSKAFDLVSHDILLKKLSYYRVGGAALNLIKSYLEEREQFVSLRNNMSTSLTVRCGVPQGSVLGPLLFLIMVNDISASVPGNIIQYADDTTNISRHSTCSQALELAKSNKKIIQNWLTANKLILNEEKTIIMLFGTRNKGYNLPVNPKFLGITLDPTLHWLPHVIGLKKTLSKSVFALKRLSRELNVDGIRQAYFGLFQAHLSYAVIVWGSTPHIKEIFTVQKKALRAMAGVGGREHCKPIFHEFRILTVFSLYILQCLLYIQSNKDKLVLRSDVHSYRTRLSNNIDVPRSRLHLSDQNPCISGSKFWNKLPIEVRELNSMLFRKTVQTFLMKNSFYSTSEFTDRMWSWTDFT